VKKGKNLADLLDSNRSEVLYYLMDHSGCSRTDLGAATGLTLASITKIIHSLLDAGIIYETDFIEGKKGRRSIGLSFCYDKFKVLAVNLFWNRLEMQACDFHGNFYGELVSIPFLYISNRNIEEVVETAGRYIQDFCRIYPDIVSIGVSVPGPYFRNTGCIMVPPFEKDPAKRSYYPLKEKLSQFTHLPIFLEHDADTGALAYWWFRTDRSSDLVIMNFLTDTGVGVGLTDGRNIYAGSSSCSSESGHITVDYHGRPCPYCGSNGCLNAYCSGRALEEIAAEQLSLHSESILNNIPTITYQAIIQASKEGDSFATELLTECGRTLGHGILSLLHVFHPDLILISGAISKAGTTLLHSMQKSLRERQSSYTTIPEIRLLSDERNLSLLGAAAFAMEQMLQFPTRYFSLPVNNQTLPAS
jgi:predicted NBD/HSP70 family sugar kinase